MEVVEYIRYLPGAEKSGMGKTCICVRPEFRRHAFLAFLASRWLKSESDGAADRIFGGRDIPAISSMSLATKIGRACLAVAPVIHRSTSSFTSHQYRQPAITHACQPETSVDVRTGQASSTVSCHSRDLRRASVATKSMINVVAVAAAFDRNKSSMHFRNLKPPSRIQQCYALCAASADRRSLDSLVLRPTRLAHENETLT